MTIEQLKSKLESEKEFFNVMSTKIHKGKLPTDNGLEINLLNPSLDGLSALQETLTLNNFYTDRRVQIKGSCLTVYTTKKD
jgi:hypothetical protein